MVKAMGSNPGTEYWIDVSDNASYYNVRKMENKGSQMGHTKKKKKKKKTIPLFSKFRVQG